MGMKLSEKSVELLNVLRDKGYDKGLCEAIAFEMHTDYTAGRMLDYLRLVPFPNDVELVDEMLAILSDRDRFVEKHRMLETEASYQKNRQQMWLDQLMEEWDDEEE